MGQNLFDLLRRGFGPLERCSRRKLHMHEQIALVLDRQEAGRDALADEGRTGAGQRQHDERDRPLVNQHAGPAEVTLGGAFEVAIEDTEEPAQQTAALRTRPQQQSGQRRAESQRIERREHYRNGDGRGELLIKTAGDSGDEDRRDEDGREHQGDADQGPGDLFHRLQ